MSLVQLDVTKKVHVYAKKEFLAKDVINANMDITVILHVNVSKIASKSFNVLLHK